MWTVIVSLMVAMAGPTVDLTTPGVLVAEIGRDGVCAAGEDGWKVASVRDWASEHATVVRLDRQADGKAIAELIDGGHSVTPMRVGWVDGVEVDRACGCMDGPALERWIGGLAAGATEASRHMTAAAAAPRLDVVGYLEAVKLAWCADRPEQAYDALELLWDRIAAERPEYLGTRNGRVLQDISRMVGRSDAVRARVVARRDALEPGIDEVAALDDWLLLNLALQEQAQNLAWYDRMQSEPTRQWMVQRQAALLYAPLMKAERWAEAGALVGDVESWSDRWLAEGMRQSAMGYGALLAAGRDKDAAKVAKKALAEADDPSRQKCGLVWASLEVGAARAAHRSWVKGCDASLQNRWSAAL